MQAEKAPNVSLRGPCKGPLQSPIAFAVSSATPSPRGLAPNTPLQDKREVFRIFMEC